MAADMGWDPNVWEDPMAFEPERNMIYIGPKRFKMTPFGVGRRMCPGYCDERKSTGPDNFEGRRDSKRNMNAFFFIKILIVFLF
uniref:Cytochrome P450 n=1 Tax=Populus trichocarpa TaxID=3694 RepID=B9IFB0_POPTR